MKLEEEQVQSELPVPISNDSSVQEILDDPILEVQEKDETIIEIETELTLTKNDIDQIIEMTDDIKTLKLKMTVNSRPSSPPTSQQEESVIIVKEKGQRGRKRKIPIVIDIEENVIIIKEKEKEIENTRNWKRTAMMIWNRFTQSPL